MNRLLRFTPEINITAARKIVDTRNYVIHSYDNVTDEIMWAIVIISQSSKLKSKRF